jgi:hypothetical protein
LKIVRPLVGLHVPGAARVPASDPMRVLELAHAVDSVPRDAGFQFAPADLILARLAETHARRVTWNTQLLIETWRSTD